MTEQERIANVGAGVKPTYHATESVEEARAVVEQCMSAKSVLNIAIASMALWPDVIDVSPQWNRTGEPREHRRYVPERGTCHAIISDNLIESDGNGDAWADCSECGHLLYVLTDPDSEPPNFCPHCGRRCVG